MRLVWRFSLVLAFLAGLALLAPRAFTFVKYDGRVVQPADAPVERVAIVFGAGLRRDGQVSLVLYDRVATAAELYHAGKVSRLLLSGDNRLAAYNEPAAMRAAALELGVSADAMTLDFAGRSTYDSCYRARAVFGVQRAILVTQSFHLPRALFLCEALGITTTGVSADRRDYRTATEAIWDLRELFATTAAVWDVFVARPTPVLGDRIDPG